MQQKERGATMQTQRNEKMTAEFDGDWNDVSIFEKLPVRKALASVMTGSVTARRRVKLNNLCRRKIMHDERLYGCSREELQVKNLHNNHIWVGLPCWLCPFYLMHKSV